MVFFFTVFEIFLHFKTIWETFFKDFANYFVEILETKLFEDDFGKTIVKLPVTYWAGYTLIAK